MAKLKSNFLDQNNPKSRYKVQEWLDLYQRFWSRSKNEQECIIRFKNSRLRLKF